MLCEQFITKLGAGIIKHKSNYKELMDENHYWKCNIEAGTFLHLMWKCSFGYKTSTREQLHKPLTESLQLCLLGDTSLLPAGYIQKQI